MKLHKEDVYLNLYLNQDTSKTLETAFGFKGESLFLISQQCKLEITSQRYHQAFSLCISFGRDRTFNVSAPLPQRGTVVVAKDIFKHLPVRKNRMHLESFLKLKRSMEILALNAPHISFELVDAQAQRMLLHVHKVIMHSLRFSF